VTEPDERHRALLRVLVRHGVRFVLVGGVALQLRGFSGATRDVDVTIAADDLNHRRLAAALETIRARPVPGRSTRQRLPHRLGQLEVMSSTDGVGDHRDWADHATSFELEPGLTVRVGSASDLLLAKEQAGRPKDLDALPLIRAELIASGALAAADVRGPVAELAREFVPDPRVEALLGPRPADRRARGLWDRAAGLVVDYRERWKVVEEDPFLGDPPPRDSAQADDRAALDRQPTRLKRLLTRAVDPSSLER
jgi:hypothetical protein